MNTTAYRKIVKLGYTVCAVFLLCACSVSPLKPSDGVSLASGEGLVGIVFDSLDELQQVSFTAESGGFKKLYIPDVEAGKTLYLFKAQAGTYCSYQFKFGTWILTILDAKLCFEIVEGKLTYGGHFSPRVIAGEVIMNQSDKTQEFIAKLADERPTIYERFTDGE